MSDIYIYLLYEIFEKQSDSTDAQQQEAPVDESREVVEARTPWEQTIPRTMTSVKRKDGPRLKRNSRLGSISGPRYVKKER